MSARRGLLIGLGLILITLLVYLPALDVLMVADDFRIVRRMGFDEAYRSLTTTVGYDRNEYRPMIAFSYAVSNAVWKGDPRGFHLEAVLLHSVNAALLFAWLALLTRSLTIAGAAAALFAVHPLNHSRVVWIAARDGLLSLFFMLVSLIAYTAWRRPSGRPAVLLPGISLIAYALGLLSYEGAVVLPPILAGLEFFVLSGREGNVAGRARHAVVRALPHAGIAAAYVCAWLLLFRAELGRHDLSLSLATISGNYSSLMYRLLHGHQYLAGVLYVLLVPLLFMIPRDRRRLMGFAVLFILAAYVPFSWINGFAARFAYFSVAGYALLLALPLAVGEPSPSSRVTPGRRKPVLALAALLLASIGIYSAVGIRTRISEWAAAGEIADRIARRIKDLRPQLHHGATLVLAGIPRMYGQAYVYPLGLRHAILRHYPGIDLNVIYGEEEFPAILKRPGADASGAILFRYIPEERTIVEIGPSREKGLQAGAGPGYS